MWWWWPVVVCGGGWGAWRVSGVCDCVTVYSLTPRNLLGRSLVKSLQGKDERGKGMSRIVSTHLKTRDAAACKARAVVSSCASHYAHIK